MKPDAGSILRGGGNENRRRIMEAIVAAPGVTKSELAQTLGVAWGTVGHHLKVLKRDGRITCTRLGKNLHVSASHFIHRLDNQEVMACHLARRIVKTLYHSTFSKGPTALATQLKVPHSKIKTVVRHLEQAGLVVGDGAYHPRYSLTEIGELVTHRLARQGSCQV